MYLSRERFIQSIEKLAQDAPGEGSNISGSQGETVPELLQPDTAPNDSNASFRGPEESYSKGSEKAEEEGSRGVLKSSFKGFENARQTSAKQLGSLLTNYGPKAAVSHESSKYAGAILSGFDDELGKIYSR